MSFPQKYVDYLVHFHGDRDYFECHEVLEDHWKENGMGRHSVWSGLIQVAVGMYHYRRGNVKGAEKLMRKSLILLESNCDALEQLGIDSSAFLEMLHNCQKKIMAGMPYEPINIPIVHPYLLKSCKIRCREQGIEWCGASVPPDDLIHRHITRNREPIIAERERMRALKGLERNQSLALSGSIG